jgi:hypothetical protein
MKKAAQMTIPNEKSIVGRRKECYENEEFLQKMKEKRSVEQSLQPSKF